MTSVRELERARVAAWNAYWKAHEKTFTAAEKACVLLLKAYEEAEKLRAAKEKELIAKEKLDATIRGEDEEARLRAAEKKRRRRRYE